MNTGDRPVVATGASQRSLIGRETERAELHRSLVEASGGRGGVVLLSGEAGVGKTRLVRDTLAAEDLQAFQASCSPTSASPYGPISNVLRTFLRSNPNGLKDTGPLSAHLSLLLPELGPAPAQSDRETLFESIRQAFKTIAASGPTVVVLDDLHWADSATLELIYGMSEMLETEPLLMVGTYRNDEIPRSHPLRRLRADLRRAGRLREMTLQPLDRDDTTRLAELVLGDQISAALASMIFDRTQGVPFFIEELSVALVSSGRLKMSSGALNLDSDEPLGIPETIRDVVLLGTNRLTERGRAALEAAAVCGLTFDLDLAAELAGDDSGLSEAIQAGLIVETDPDTGTFRHALTRDAIYGEILWNRRRAMHRRLATLLEQNAAPAGDIADHWFAARDYDRARHWLLRSADDDCAVHAYRDAAQALKRALDIWPDNGDESHRLDVLSRLAECAQIASDFTTAIRSWREIAEVRAGDGEFGELARVNQQLSIAFELQGTLDHALAARLSAAAALQSIGRSRDALDERLAAAGLYQRMGSHQAALEIAQSTINELDPERDSQASVRSLIIEGVSLLQTGQVSPAIEPLQTALELALRHDLVRLASEVYLHLGFALQNAADYSGSRQVFMAAIDFCQTRNVPGMVATCEVCLAGTLFQTGQWDEAAAIAGELVGRDDVRRGDRVTALGVMGGVLGWRGDAREARPILVEAVNEAWQIGHVIAVLICNWTLAGLDEREGRVDSAAERCRYLLNNWERVDNPNILASPLRWSVSFFARHGMRSEANACTQQLATLSTRMGTTESMADLAAAIGEIGLLEGDPSRAATQFEQALDLLRDIDVPFERAQILLRSGVASAKAGLRETAIQRMTDAYRTARKIGADPLADEATRELAALGESPERHLGRRAGRRLASGGLTRRELEVLRLLASGRTNREIAHDLFLSPRTVEMHVGNVLSKLGCHTRTEAVTKAGELGLLG